MRQTTMVLAMASMLLVPVYASAQSPDRITLIDNFGTYQSGEPFFVYGQIASLADDAFLIMQIINPNDDLCQIQQLVPLPSGTFMTDVIPLRDRICGVPGEYEVRLFYGDHYKSATFDVSPARFSAPDAGEKAEIAQQLIADHTSAIGRILGIPSSAPPPTATDLSELESIYVGRLAESFPADLIHEIDPLIRNAVSSSLNAVQQLLDDDEITIGLAESIRKTAYASIFYYEIGDKAKSIGLLSDAFVDVRNVTPEKITKRAPTFDELEDSLLSLMTRSGTAMSKAVKHEIATIFARGTAPVYSGEIAEITDMLSRSGYLDIVSRKESDLYRLVQNNWESLKPSLQSKGSIEKLLELGPRVTELYQASTLLREMDHVDRFISSDSGKNTDLANLLLPDWDDLASSLSLASSVDDILESKAKINQMAQIIEISSRIDKSVEISQSSGVNSKLVGDWRQLLKRVEDAQSSGEILRIVSEFDQSITQLREKRDPLTTLEFDYETLKKKAELQADHANLFRIDSALKIIKTAKQMESGTPSASRIDRIEVLLTWASETLPKIRADLNSYAKDTSKVRASEVLQRAKSLENLVDLSLTKNRFLPNYVNFTDKINDGIRDVRDLVIKKDLDRASKLVRDLFDEWHLVSKAYADDPRGSKVGYSLDELDRIEFRKTLDAYDDAVSNFYNTGFDRHNEKYEQLEEEAYDLIALGNFVDAEAKINEIGDFLSKYLVLSGEDIIYDISFDQEKEIWVLSGATKKSRFDYRENLYVTVYTTDGKTHSSLEFTDTRQGNFHTRWAAPTEPGLYVVMLQYLDSKGTRIVHVEKEFDRHAPQDPNLVDLAREFKDLESFAKKFGGDNYENSRFASVLGEIKAGFDAKNPSSVKSKLDEMRALMERYLPVRNPEAPIQAIYDGGKLVISGRVLKLVEFSEDLFVDIYDQRGDLVKSIALKDDPTGLFNEVVSQPLKPGSYVVKLQYHDKLVTDYFNVR